MSFRANVTGGWEGRVRALCPGPSPPAGTCTVKQLSATVFIVFSGKRQSESESRKARERRESCVMSVVQDRGRASAKKRITRRPVEMPHD